MAHLLNYGVVSWTIPVVILTSLLLSGCSNLRPETEIKTVVKVEKVQIPIVARPKPVQLSDTRVFVVTKDNYEEFAKEFTETYGELAFVALSMKDYENLALNIADLRRYINQQTEIIVYYEKAVTEDKQQENQ
jgi:hypothetical protein